MTKRDDEILASIGMTIEDVDEIAHACEAGDYSMWDFSHVFHESPFDDEMATMSVQLPESKIAAMKKIEEQSGVNCSEFVRRAIDQEL